MTMASRNSVALRFSLGIQVVVDDSQICPCWEP